MHRYVECYHRNAIICEYILAPGDICTVYRTLSLGATLSHSQALRSLISELQRKLGYIAD